MKGPTLLGRSGLPVAVLAAGFLLMSCGDDREDEDPGPSTGPPQITWVFPETGDVWGGLEVAVTTSNFRDDFLTNTPQVFFGADAAAVTPIDPVTVRAVTPPHLTEEAVDVEVRSTGIVETAVLIDGFTYRVPPPGPPCTVLSASPGQGSTVGGDILLIDGTHFDVAPVPPPTVEFGAGNPAASVLVLGPRTLEAVTPAGSPGMVELIVTTQAGPCTQPDAFEYFAPGPCVIADVYPREGFDTGGTTVFLEGVNFDQPPLPTPTVEFGAGNIASDVTVLNRSLLRVASPPTPAGPGGVDVTVTTQLGPCFLAGAFDYLPTPLPPVCNINTLDPRTGPEAGGNRVTIYGSGFTIFSRVWLGAIEVIPVDFISDQELRVDAPGGVGAVDVRVELGWGVSCSTPGGYRYIPCVGQPCQLSQVTPGTGEVRDLVTLRGDRFEAGATVLFGNASATIVDESLLPTELVVVVPTLEGASRDVDVQVLNPSGTCCAKNGAFTYSSCIIQSLDRKSGPHGGGRFVVIDGLGFSVNPLPAVWFGTELCPTVVSQGPNQIIIETPPSAGQTIVDVTVVNPSGESCTCVGCFRFGGCSFDTIVPDTGGTNGGDLVTIRGSEFDLLNITVEFGSIYADYRELTVDPTGTEMTLLSPPSPSGGAKDIEVFNLVYQSRCTDVDGFTYILPRGGPCTVTDVSPRNGIWDGGDLVTIRGSGFDSNTGVIFGLAGTSQVTFVSPDELQVITPLFRSGGVHLPTVDVIVAPQNRDPCVLPQAFSYGPPPPPCPLGGCVIFDVTPNFGPVGGGNGITITGDNFCDVVPQVMFGSEPGSVTFMSPTELQVTVPPSISGSGRVPVLYYDIGECYALCQGCYTYN